MEQEIYFRKGVVMQTTLEFDIKRIEKSWVAFDQLTHLRPIINEAEYDRAVSLMNTLLDKVGSDENHPLSSLLELVSDLVSGYDERHFVIEASEPKEVLRFLIGVKNLTQKDLVAIVPQSNLSAILAGKRNISASLASKFGTFFKVSPAVFIG
ncbi:MAG: type II toxin-antitoxin system HigA family antitoxin [Methylophilaceae bacterium]